MKIGTFLNNLTEFSLDLIGTLIPGTVLLVGLAFATGQLESLGDALTASADLNVPLAVIAAYVLGHALAGLGRFTVRSASREMRSRLLGSGPVEAFHRALGSPYPLPTAPEERDTTFGILRNEALTYAEDRATTYRFMFLALFHLGTASALFMSVVAYLVFLPLRPATAFVPALLGCMVALAVAYLLRTRWESFYGRAMRLPFALANVALRKAGKPKASPVASADGLRIYLAGGFHSGWQDRVSDALGDGYAFIDPRSNGLDDPDAYTAWDLVGLESADLVFAHAETTNPGLYSLALEVGYARAKGKWIVLVDEKGAADETAKRYLGMVRSSADVVLDTLDEGVGYLRQLAEASGVKQTPPEGG